MRKGGDLAVKTAQVNAAKANVGRLLAMKAFSRIVAPIRRRRHRTQDRYRRPDQRRRGATTNSELFNIAKVDRLRLYVSVPQVDSALIRPGVAVSLTVPQYPGKTFPATLLTNSNAVATEPEPCSWNCWSTMPPGCCTRGLRPGSPSRLPSDAAISSPTVRIPSSALLFRKSGAEAAVVGPDDHVRPCAA